MKGMVLALLVAGTIAAGLRWGTFAAGGSDSYCYVHQAERWASGRLQVPEPLALEAPWPDAAATFTPTGHVPSSTVPGAIAPICPPGLSMVMAPFLALGGPRAIFLVVPIFGALLVLATWTVGARFGARIGLASAALTAASPVFLYQLMQPMSDVPAAALWVSAVAAVTGTKWRAPLLGGLATGAAVLMRPNLAPLAIPIGLFLLFRAERSWRERLRAAATYAACAVPGLLIVALIQYRYYGSPLSSGYGSLEALFSMANVAPNATRFASWLSRAHTPLWLLAALAPVLLPGRLSGLLLALFVVNVACYLPYVVFQDWSYLRFLLPTLPLVLVLVTGVFDSAWRRMKLPGPRVALALTTLVLAALAIRESRALSVFELQRLESRYERAGTFVAERLPANALVITSWESGSVRFYSGRLTLAWDVLDPAWLDRALTFVRTRGFEPYLLFESQEEPIFRQRFAGSDTGRLDWPPMAQVASQVRIYRPDDRERYYRGVQPPTEFVR